MGFADRYLEKQVVLSPVALSFSVAVVIPCFDEPNLAHTIQSLNDCVDPECSVAIIVVVNSSQGAPSNALYQNRNTLQELEQLKSTLQSWLQLVVIHVDQVPVKLAGAGWARKLGMDCAVSYFNQWVNPHGIILSLDADCTVASNYLSEVVRYFKSNPKLHSATIGFEHLLNQLEPQSLLAEGIVYYELYLRYFKHALQLAGFPHAIYTIGSCFAVRADAYVKQGGMNRRQAGEDFYFLHKMAQLGVVGEINTTQVYPGVRESNRVPFGTGPTLQRWVSGDRSMLKTYSLDHFIVLKQWFDQLELMYRSEEFGSSHPLLNDFLTQNEFQQKLRELHKHCSRYSVFKSRFFHVFNALAVIQWLNYSSSREIETYLLTTEALSLLWLLGFSCGDDDPKLLLNLYRELDRSE